MHIMTEEGWKQLEPPCLMEIWKRCSWDNYSKKYVVDSNGRLTFLGYACSLPSVEEERKA